MKSVALYILLLSEYRHFTDRTTGKRFSYLSYR